MTRSELIERIAAKMPNLTIKEVEHIVNVVFGKITKTLAEGNRVEIRGFGTFSTNRRDARTTFNPKNKEQIYVPAKNIIRFRTGKELHDKLNA